MKRRLRNSWSRRREERHAMLIVSHIGAVEMLCIHTALDTYQTPRLQLSPASAALERVQYHHLEAGRIRLTMESCV